MNETIFVLGLGETLKYFKDFDKDAIGVNDIWKHVETKYIMCLDSKTSFTHERLKRIRTSWPDIFYSHLKEWEPHFKSHFQKLPLVMGQDKAGGSFEPGKLYYSTNTTFTACSLAATQGYKNIVMYGADFNTHPNIKGPNQIKTVLTHFKWLNDNLKPLGINLFIGHPKSKLSQVLPLWK